VTRHRSDDDDLFVRLIAELARQEDFVVLKSTYGRDWLWRRQLTILFESTLDALQGEHWIDEHFEV